MKQATCTARWCPGRREKTRVVMKSYHNTRIDTAGLFRCVAGTHTHTHTAVPFPRTFPANDDVPLITIAAANIKLAISQSIAFSSNTKPRLPER